MPKLEPLTEFICDECEEIIEKPEDGWVEWLDYRKENKTGLYQVIYNFRIVHHKEASPSRSCYYTNLYEDYEGTEATTPLHYFLKYQGLARALGKLQDHAEGYTKFKNSEAYLQILDLIRRITIPYFEEGRQYLNEYYLEWTGEREIIYGRLDTDTMQRFLNWIEEQEYDRDF